jgi:hypothetical protein
VHDDCSGTGKSEREATVGEAITDDEKSTKTVRSFMLANGSQLCSFSLSETGWLLRAFGVWWFLGFRYRCFFEKVDRYMASFTWLGGLFIKTRVGYKVQVWLFAGLDLSSAVETASARERGHDSCEL